MFEAVVKGIRLNSEEGREKKKNSISVSTSLNSLVNETIGLIRFDSELTNLDSLEFIEKLYSKIHLLHFNSKLEDW